MAALSSLLQQKLSATYKTSGEVQLQAVGGGSINQCFRVRYNGQQLFCKLNSATKFPHLFRLEQKGLQLLRRTGCIRTPEVIDRFEAEDDQFLLLEWIDEGPRTAGFWSLFGQKLATLHSIQSDRYGLQDDNYMGSVPQQNKQQKTWCLFFTEQRLQPLAERCAGKGLLHSGHLAQLEAATEKLPLIFEEEKPSLLHGDLWSGNFLCAAGGEPVLIDPAVYYGHRSVDLAMTTLFGGFEKPFYEAYHYHLPLPPNFREQWEICNLYPLLIHLYLFGTGYLPRIEKTLKQFC